MAVITPTALALNVASADLKIAGGTAIVHAATDTIVYPQEGKLLLILNNTFAGAKIVTIEAGNAIGAGVGAMDVSIAQDAVEFLVVDSSRFKTFGVAATGGGVLTLNYEAGMTGFVMAVTLP
jgi:hypothetical protein